MIIEWRDPDMRNRCGRQTDSGKFATAVAGLLVVAGQHQAVVAEHMERIGRTADGKECMPGSGRILAEIHPVGLSIDIEERIGRTGKIAVIHTEAIGIFGNRDVAKKFAALELVQATDKEQVAFFIFSGQIGFRLIHIYRARLRSFPKNHLFEVGPVGEGGLALFGTYHHNGIGIEKTNNGERLSGIGHRSSYKKQKEERRKNSERFHTTLIF